MNCKLIAIGNNVMDISSTNFWETSWAQSGLCFLSWNAGAGRLLVPKQTAKTAMSDMLTAKKIIIDRRSCRPGLRSTHFDVVFDDGSNRPYVLSMSHEMTDRSLGSACNKPRPFSVWTESGGKVITLKATVE
jgi:hypothetical protein